MARRDRRRATTGALAASLLVHLALFIVLTREVAPHFRTPARAEPDFQVQLVAEPPTGEPPSPVSTRRSPRRTVQTPASPIAPPLTKPRHVAPSPARGVPVSRPPPPRPTPVLPAPPTRSAGPVTPGGARNGVGAGASHAPGAGPWAVQGEDDGQDGVRAFLRATVGCSHQDYVNLTAGERAACDRRVAQAARVGAERVDGLSAEARSAFDAAVRAREEARTARMQEPFVPCEGVGSSLDRGCINMKSKHPDDGP